VYSHADANESVYAMASVTTDLGALGDVAQIPWLQRSAADTARAVSVRDEGGDDAFDDDLVLVAFITGQHDAAVAAEMFAHVSSPYSFLVCVISEYPFERCARLLAGVDIAGRLRNNQREIPSAVVPSKFDVAAVLLD
jgi:hypothetical protein